jgi:hypothetical protein
MSRSEPSENVLTFNTLLFFKLSQLAFRFRVEGFQFQIFEWRTGKKVDGFCCAASISPTKYHDNILRVHGHFVSHSPQAKITINPEFPNRSFVTAYTAKFPPCLSVKVWGGQIVLLRTSVTNMLQATEQ